MKTVSELLAIYEVRDVSRLMEKLEVSFRGNRYIHGKAAFYSVDEALSYAHERLAAITRRKLERE